MANNLINNKRQANNRRRCHSHSHNNSPKQRPHLTHNSLKQHQWVTLYTNAKQHYSVKYGEVIAPQWEDWKFIPDYFATYNRPEITLDDTKQALAQLANAMGSKGCKL